MSAAAVVRDKLSGKVGLTRVTRYRPGMLPKWVHDLDADDYHRDLPRSASAPDRPFPGRDGAARDDRGLAEISRAELRADHHRVRQQAEIVFTVEEEESEPREAEDVAAAVVEEDDEGAQKERRRRIRERRLLREREELLPREEEEELAADSHSEYETDSEGDEGIFIAVVKPVFVPKPRRDTISERERIKEERRQLEELVKRRVEDRKVETKRIVVEVIMKEEHIEKAPPNEEDVAIVDTDDEANEAEYEAWKNREIARIKRDREERVTRLREKVEVELVWKMTEEGRREWERRNPKPVAQPKKKLNFMQRYYHEGAFFQERVDDGSQKSGLDDIFQRDFSAATGEDKMDKSILPKVMQVRHFGRRGARKWTHLVNEDTTDWNNPL